MFSNQLKQKKKKKQRNKNNVQEILKTKIRFNSRTTSVFYYEKTKRERTRHITHLCYQRRHTAEIKEQ